VGAACVVPAAIPGAVIAASQRGATWTSHRRSSLAAGAAPAWRPSPSCSRPFGQQSPRSDQRRHRSRERSARDPAKRLYLLIAIARPIKLRAVAGEYLRKHDAFGRDPMLMMVMERRIGKTPAQVSNPRGSRVDRHFVWKRTSSNCDAAPGRRKEQTQCDRSLQSRSSLRRPVGPRTCCLPHAHAPRAQRTPTRARPSRACWIARDRSLSIGAHIGARHIGGFIPGNPIAICGRSAAPP